MSEENKNDFNNQFDASLFLAAAFCYVDFVRWQRIFQCVHKNMSMSLSLINGRFKSPDNILLNWILFLFHTCVLFSFVHALNVFRDHTN